MNKCIKGESCLHCDTDYCRFKDEIAELKAENEKLKTDIAIYKGIIDADKAEIERLKGENDSFMNGEYCANGCKKMNNTFQDVYKCLIQENERLKKQYNCYACDSCGGKEDYINMKRHTENAIKTVHKYRQALQEIREIADNQKITADYSINKIIEKINEVMGEK